MDDKTLDVVAFHLFIFSGDFAGSPNNPSVFQSALKVWRSNKDTRISYRENAKLLIQLLSADGITLSVTDINKVVSKLDTIMTVPSKKAYELNETL